MELRHRCWIDHDLHQYALTKLGRRREFGVILIRHRRPPGTPRSPLAMGLRMHQTARREPPAWRWAHLVSASAAVRASRVDGVGSVPLYPRLIRRIHAIQDPHRCRARSAPRLPGGILQPVWSEPVHQYELAQQRCLYAVMMLPPLNKVGVVACSKRLRSVEHTVCAANSYQNLVGQSSCTFCFGGYSTNGALGSTTPTACTGRFAAR